MSEQITISYTAGAFAVLAGVGTFIASLIKGGRFSSKQGEINRKLFEKVDKLESSVARFEASQEGTTKSIEAMQRTLNSILDALLNKSNNNTGR